MSSDPAEILTRMAAAYAACTSYCDDGVVTTTFFSPSRVVQRRPFSTRFVRDQGFLFEFRSRRGEDDWDQYAVWNENGRTRTWWSKMPKRDEAESLATALAGGTGVSGGSAYRVPHLLMPEMYKDNGAARPPEAFKLLESSEAELEGCVVIERVRDAHGAEQIWIDRSTLLIRRVIAPRHPLRPPPPEAVERLKAINPAAAAEMAKRLAERAGRESAEVETTTVYEAAFNPSIRVEELVFTRPG